MQSLAWSKVGKPFNLQLHNIAFKKEEFYNVNGFINHLQQRMFTDACCINEAGTAKNNSDRDQRETMVEVPTLENKADFTDFNKEQISLLKTFKHGTTFKLKYSKLCHFSFLASFVYTL